MKTGNDVGWYASSTVAPYSPKARSQESSNPARIPPAASGSATRKKRAKGRWPRVAATSSKPGSSVANVERAAMIRKGAATNVWARTTPTSESVRRRSKKRPRVLYGPTRKMSRIPPINGGTANGNWTAAPTTPAIRLRDRASTYASGIPNTAISSREMEAVRTDTHSARYRPGAAKPVSCEPARRKANAITGTVRYSTTNAPNQARGLPIQRRVGRASGTIRR